ncbi:hypothetical protein [Shinella zoogloeoides]
MTGVAHFKSSERSFEPYGDVLGVPKGTALAYEGERATVFYALAPVDWRTRDIRA